MSKTISIEQDDFKRGLQLLEDDSMADFGSARKMLNVVITDRGGISNRPGTELLGSHNTSSSRVRGLFNFKKGGDEILTKMYDDEVEYYHTTAGWQRLKSGFTADQEFGYAAQLARTDNDIYMVMCNRTEDFQKWTGAVTLLNGALAGGETAVTVDSTLKEQVFYNGTASATAATTIDVSTSTWTADQWNNSFYVYITSGTHAGKVRKITDGTATQITFDTLGSDAGGAGTTFQIRRLAFPVSGTIIYGGTTIAYTDIPTATTFTVSSAHAAADDTPVTLVPEVFPGAPKGNRIETLLGRTIVGNVRSGISRDSSGNLQGSDATSSVFVSKLSDPTAFTFSASRVAGEGDILAMPYGGDVIEDVKAQEDVCYVYKPTYIEAFKYTGDADDYAVRSPIKTGVGSKGRVVKGRDDQYFMSSDGQYTSIGRVSSKDVTPQTENLGLQIKRLLDTYGHDDFNGIEYKDKIYTAHKTDPDSSANNVVLVRNKTTKSFEGVWTLPAGFFEAYDGELVYGESAGANVWKMLQSNKSDKQSSLVKYPVTSIWQSNFFNLLPIKANQQAICSVALEGYITGGTEFTFSLYKDFSDTASLTFTFGGTEEEFLQGSSSLSQFLGANPLGLTPLGTISDPDADGRRRFSFMVYFPYQYGQYFSTGIQSEGKDLDWELIRISLGVKESVSTRVKSTKVL